MMKKNLSTMLIALVAFIAFGMQSCSKSDSNDDDEPTPTPTPTVEQADYTLFVYGHAGGRMDWIIENVYENVKPLLTDNKKLRVLFFYKYGHKNQDFDFSGKYANEDEVLRFELTSTTDLSKLRTEACFEEKSKFQLYDQQNLTEQLNWVAKTAPAKNYIIMLYGHGAGFSAKDDYLKEPIAATRAVLYDEGFNGRGMNMYEFKEGIEASAIKHPQMIYFQNCLMGNLESLTTLRYVTDYFVGSEHVLASTGHIVIEFIKDLLQTTDVEAATKQMFANLEPWKKGYTESSGSINGDLFFMKALAIDEVNEQIDWLSYRLGEIYPTQREAIDRATCRVYQPYPTKPLFDAADYADCLARETGDAQLQTISKDLRDAFDKAFICRAQVNNLPSALNAYTLSITIVDKNTYNMELTDDTGWTFRFSDSYKINDFHVGTYWGDWLAENEQTPTGNPCGMPESESGEEEEE
jgi:hypothetical protein